MARWRRASRTRVLQLPANAILNYLYAILEGEATLAARIVGLDPGLGVLHADQLNRDSLSADLMEPIRPLADRYVFDLLARRAFASADFFETRQGVCRVTPPLARELCHAAVDFGRAVGRVAEDVARLLDDGRSSGRPIATPVSGRNRRHGRMVRGTRPRPKLAPQLGAACVWCGGSVEAGRRTCSTECEEALAVDNRPAFVAAGQRSLARLREVGFAPELSPESRSRIGTRATALLTAAREWQRTHPWPTDLSEFERGILPGLVDVSAGALAEATGLSLGYCRRVKAGAVRPHPMWWEAMGAISRK